MDHYQPPNPISLLSKSEVVKRTLDYLYVPLQFYIRSMLQQHVTEEEANKMMEKYPGRAGDVPHMFDLAIKYRQHFAELSPVINEAKCIRKVRNCWAHSEPLDESTVIRFLLACELVVGAVCTEQTIASYEQIKAMRQCYIIHYAEKLLQEITTADEHGNPIVSYPTLMPAFEES